MNNPFTPNFGQIPRKIAGRSELIHEIELAIDEGLGNPALTTLLIGARGTGKTALMSYISEKAVLKGWIAVNVHCGDGMLEDIYQQAIRKGESVLRKKSNKKNTEINVSTGIFGAKISFEDNLIEPNWRTKITSVIEQLNTQGLGLYITVDEVDVNVKEIVELSKVYQLLIRDGFNVGLLLAGLPHNVSLLLNDKSVSFLRRSNQRYITSIADYEIEDAFYKTIKEAGKDISKSALVLAVNKIAGYPYMMQLIGYRAWQESGDKKNITENDIVYGIEMANNDLKIRVLKTTLDEISDMGILFMKALSEFEEPVTVAQISKKLEKTSSYVSNYKKKLLEYGVIEDTGRGKIRFALPGLKEYISEYIEQVM